MKAKRITSFVLSVLFLIIGVLIGFVALVAWQMFMLKNDGATNGELSIHFMELGNNYTGDSIYIKSGNTDILIDGGSRVDSSTTIKSYLDNFVEDEVIEYLIVTHGDQDHIAALAGDSTHKSLFDYYKFETIIDFPKTDKNTAVLNRYFTKRDNEVSTDGATHYTALQCYYELDGAKKSYELSDGVKLNILYNYFYENSSADENNYSVCFEIVQGDSNRYLFTGDLELDGETKLVENNDLSKVKLFKAGHHGSKTSSNEVLLNIIQPEIVVCTCVAGSVQYTDNLENTFPTQAFIDRVSKYTDKVYVTTLGHIQQKGVKGNGSIDYEDIGFESMNGNIVINCKRKAVSVECSNNSTLLKDTDWFSTYRQVPSAWAK